MRLYQDDGESSSVVCVTLALRPRSSAPRSTRTIPTVLHGPGAHLRRVPMGAPPWSGWRPTTRPTTRRGGSRCTAS